MTNSQHMPLVRILLFARAAELCGARETLLELPAPASVYDAWSHLQARSPELAELKDATRVARNGHLASFDDVLLDGDELALLPPVGGG